jgi:hypothetical protein
LGIAGGVGALADGIFGFVGTTEVGGAGLLVGALPGCFASASKKTEVRK